MQYRHEFIDKQNNFGLSNLFFYFCKIVLFIFYRKLGYYIMLCIIIKSLIMHFQLQASDLTYISFHAAISFTLATFKMGTPLLDWLSGVEFQRSSLNSILTFKYVFCELERNCERQKGSPKKSISLWRKKTK